jgi:hypothetical protein
LIHYHFSTKFLCYNNLSFTHTLMIMVFALSPLYFRFGESRLKFYTTSTSIWPRNGKHWWSIFPAWNTLPILHGEMPPCNGPLQSKITRGAPRCNFLTDSAENIQRSTRVLIKRMQDASLRDDANWSVAALLLLLTSWIHGEQRTIWRAPPRRE